MGKSKIKLIYLHLTTEKQVVITLHEEQCFESSSREIDLFGCLLPFNYRINLKSICNSVRMVSMPVVIDKKYVNKALIFRNLRNYDSVAYLHLMFTCEFIVRIAFLTRTRRIAFTMSVELYI